MVEKIDKSRVIEQSYVRRDLMAAVSELLDSASDKHSTDELIDAVASVQSVTMALEHKSAVCGPSGLRGWDGEEY
ncbi:hypothetical protein [Lacticaseibacillus paracasei]|uniref:Uncharacterized protein n=1 Tax=Lacticaseibacillus paracasei (strain ATCC 334 / BCRC 17002 / CCUG 31169 / CIP 107868 / KCTC 3260 / NRRL B-441) TaxID=321967 RepID=Q037F6_LACP3|nr:hypothetical protein [Lacticaseibacillus paracasei]ABD83358.1 hypothetical protein Lcas004 [Lacticaseibacillus paracasei ATCC 334]ABJ70666.1 hypothetical protein LSEI_1908 [Lacticaseibacillus paracasei ATCC 334]OSY81338.1 hypothetical protein BLW95_02300 [Lacticaseibacillus paracasei]